MRPLSIFIGRRLSFKTPRPDGSLDRKTSPGVVIAVGGIALSVFIMLMSIAIVSGFKNEIKRKITGFTSQISLRSPGQGAGNVIPLDRIGLEDRLMRVAPDARFSSSVDLSGVLKTDSAFQGVIIRGISEGDTRDFISSNLINGRLWKNDEPGIVISEPTARALSLRPDDKVYAHFFVDDQLTTRRLTVTGIFETNFTDYDKKFAFADPNMIAKVAGVKSGECLKLEITGLKGNEIETTKEKISQLLLSDALISHSGIYPIVESVNEIGAPYLSWLELLDTNVVVILILMSCVAGFTLISSLFILTLERVKMIGILKSIGANNSQIRGIFIYMAERLVVWGMIAGNFVGIGLVVLQNKTHFLPLDPDSYYLSYVPAEISLSNILILNLCVLAATAIILILPSHLISNLSPSESMRYE